MLISETKEILRKIALIDNRKVSPEVIEAWHGVIGAIPYEIAQEALKLAQQDATIKYLEPRHIFAWSKEAAFRLDRTKPDQQVPNLRGTPEPLCRHDRKLLSCKECCRALSKMEHLTAEDLTSWAQSNIYAKLAL